MISLRLCWSFVRKPSIFLRISGRLIFHYSERSPALIQSRNAFGDLTPHIHALETGLSSDPPMNWRLSALDSYQLISNSDAHSPAKLGREANLIEGELSYPALKKAIETGEGLQGTIEFFPEEGKYHFDGHRKCHLCLSPAEAPEV